MRSSFPDVVVENFAPNLLNQFPAPLMVRQGGPGDGEEDEEREDVHGVCVDDVGGQLTLPNMSIWFCMSFSDSVSKSVLPNYVYISPLSINCYRPISVQY